MQQVLTEILKSFVALFIILDPFLGLAVFIPLTRSMDKKEKAREAAVAVLVALGLLLVFLFSGLILLDLLGISLASFIVAGGVILLILGIDVVLGIEFQKKTRNAKAAAVIIGTPLLCGPGAMTTIIILSENYGYVAPVIASILALAITWLMLYFSDKIGAIMGERLIEVLSRVLGLVIAALATEFIKNGVVEMIMSLKGA
jgi:multiple antibiotic resistance protein